MPGRRIRNLIILALGMFAGVVSLALIVNQGAMFEGKYPWFLGNTISWYVGRRTWSAILFFWCNVFVLVVMGIVLWKIGEKWRMPKLYFAIIVVLVAMFIWLSVFPTGYFDVDMKKSTVSVLHELGARGLFASLIIEMLFLIWKVKEKWFRVSGIIYILYALFCTLAYLNNWGFFRGAVLIFESSYILGFMMILLIFSSKLDRACD